MTDRDTLIADAEQRNPCERWLSGGVCMDVRPTRPDMWCNICLIKGLLTLVREDGPRRRLDELASGRCRAAGWDGYKADPLTDDAIAAARQFLNYNPAIVPLADGGLQIEWHTAGCTVELEFGSDGKPCDLYGATVDGQSLTDPSREDGPREQPGPEKALSRVEGQPTRELGDPRGLPNEPASAPELKLRTASECVGWLNSEGPLHVSPSIEEPK
jgi:hypothetical protein